LRYQEIMYVKIGLKSQIFQVSGLAFQVLSKMFLFFCKRGLRKEEIGTKLFKVI
jgi:hypothetical protein